jgi:hypothetical protein
MSDISVLENTSMSGAGEDISAVSSLVDRGICPVCQRRCGRLHPRLSLMNHLRRSNEKQHVLFKDIYWKCLFPIGYRGQKVVVPPSLEDRVLYLVSQYGEKQCIGALSSTIRARHVYM